MIIILNHFYIYLICTYLHLKSKLYCEYLRDRINYKGGNNGCIIAPSYALHYISIVRFNYKVISAITEKYIIGYLSYL
jgi:hypothetical protein